MRQEIREEYERLLLKEALYEYTLEEGQELLKLNEELAKEEEYRPTSQNKKQMKREIRRCYRQNWVQRELLSPQKALKKAAIIGTVILTTTGTSLVTVQAIKKQIFYLNTEQKNNYMKIELVEQEYNEKSIVPDSLSKHYALTWLPEGYTFREKKEYNNNYMIIYHNTSKNTVFFNIKDEKLNSLLNIKEEEKPEAVMINGREGILSINDEAVILVWATEQKIFTISTTYSENCREQVIKMAESVKYIG